MYKEDKLVDDYLNIQQQADENRRRRANATRIKKDTHRKAIPKAILSAVTAAVIAVGGAYAAGVPDYIDGQNQIVDEFYEATSSYGVTPTNDGYYINRGGEYSNTQQKFNQMVDEMILLAKKAGMTDEEVYIGLEKKVSETAAKDAYGYSMDLSTKWDVCTGKSNTKTR